MSSAALAHPDRDLVLGRYRPVRPLGSGGNGSVWLARDERNGLDVALKIIPKEGKAAARAEREAQAATLLRHERCVRAYDVGHDTRHVYIAYEYVAGHTVREALRSGRLGAKAAVEVAAQALDALAHAHARGIIHRDVKPSNMLLEDGDTVAVRLLDFGLAQFDGADTLTAVGDVPGTLAYISPERLRGEETTPASDVWAVGVFLWEALAGRHPFWGVPIPEVARAIEAGAPPIAGECPRLPRRVHAAIDAALSPDPARRPSAAALALDLHSALRGSQETVRVPQDTAERETATRHDQASVPVRATFAALAALAALVGMGLLPFWPALAVGALAVVTALVAYFEPRVGLALAVAAPILPLGNYALGAAVAYSALAAAWLALFWRSPRGGLAFVLGPVLAPLGLLGVVPILVQPVRGVVRRAASAGTAVFAAALVGAAAGGTLPVTGRLSGPLGLAGSESPTGVASAIAGVLGTNRELAVAAVGLAVVTAVLPLARRSGPWTTGGLGAIVVLGGLVSGAPVLAMPIVAIAWAGVALVGRREPGIVPPGHGSVAPREA